MNNLPSFSRRTALGFAVAGAFPAIPALAQFRVEVSGV